MAGIARLRKIQLGAEATPGTPVAATTIWRGLGAFIGDLQEVVAAREDVGYIGGTDRTLTVGKGARLGMPATAATFEQLLYVLMGGVANVSPTGAGDAKTWTFPLATTSAPSVKTYTIEAGDNQQAHEMEYSHVEEFRLWGAQAGALYMASTWRGRQRTPASFTGSLSVPPVEEVAFSVGKLYIDAAGGTLGATEKSGTLLRALLNVRTGLRPYHTGDGKLYFTGLSYDEPAVGLMVTFLYNGTATAEEANFRNETARLIRLQWEGSELEEGVNRTLRVDLAGKWTRFEVVGEERGKNVVRAHFQARYDTTASKFAELVVINALASLP